MYKRSPADVYSFFGLYRILLINLLTKITKYRHVQYTGFSI